MSLFIKLISIGAMGFAQVDVVDIKPEDGLKHVNKQVRIRMLVKKTGRARSDLSLNSVRFKDGL